MIRESVRRKPGRTAPGPWLATIALAALALATSAAAAQYPPGPAACCPDTLTIANVRNPLASPHPVTGDVVLGVGGIITAFDVKPGPYGFYMQMSNGLPYSGVAVITGNNDRGPGTTTNLQVGDSVVVYGRIQDYQGGTAIGSTSGGDEVAVPADNSGDTGGLVVRVVSHGNPLPPFHVGTLAALDEHSSNPAAGPWEGMLVRLDAPLQVEPVPTRVDLSLASPFPANAFLVIDPACAGAACDTAFVDGSTLATVTPPPPGTLLAFVQGVFDLRSPGFRVQLRGGGDLEVGTPPALADAFPTYDNDLHGSARLDSIMVVFDRPVDKTTAENPANYSLASLGAIDGAHRLDSPEDNRVVLQVHNGLNDGDPEAITVGGVKSLADGTSMLGPQTRGFLNGVIELESLQAPDPGFLSGTPCQDRSRFAGPGTGPGSRLSFDGTVTGAFGSLYALQDTAGTRSGVWATWPGPALAVGHRYVLAGAIQDVDGENEGVGLVYAQDLGSGPPALPAVQSVHVLRDTTCDAAQLFLTGQDYEGMLVTLVRVAITATGPAGSSFFVANPGAGAPPAAARLRARRTGVNALPAEQIQVGAMAGKFTFAPDSGQIVTVTGVLRRQDGSFVVYPRSEGDLQGFGPVPTFSIPLDASKAATASRDPDIVLGPGGGLFMAWGRNFHEAVHALSLDNSANWSQARSIAHQGIQPAVTATSSGRIGVLACGVAQLYFKQSTDGGFEMDPLVTPVDPFPTQYPALTVGSGEHLHAAWERTSAGIYYSRSLTAGASFSNPVPIAPDTLPGETNSMARVCASKGDSVYVVWQYQLVGEPYVDKVLYSRSLDGGNTFSRPRLVRDERNPLSSTVKLAFLGDAQVGPDGTVYVMGLQDGGPTDSVAFLRSTNGGATFALVGHLPTPAQTGTCPKSFAVGPGGTIHALVGVCGTALYYTRSTDGGVTWGPLSNVTSSQSSSIGEPRGARIILDGTGTPVVVWFAPVGGSTEIYSARLLN